MTEYSVFPLSVLNKEAFLEATAEELRVLLFLIERGGRIESEEELSRLCSVSRPRCAGAIRFWCAAEVIKERSADAPSITEEFEERIVSGEIIEVPAKKVAETIRNDALCDMINECASLMGKSTLSTPEIKKLTALYEQYKLSAEYIVTLCAYLAERGKLSVTTLINQATRLCDKEIDTVEALETYIADSESHTESNYLFRGIFGIYSRNLSKTEKELFSKWSNDFGYFTEIVTEAYDIAVSKVEGRNALIPYADRLLTRWHECGCHTAEECRKQYEKDEEERRKNHEAEAPTSRKKREKTERYGNFNVEDAFLRALDRSYSEDSNN